MVLGCHKNMYWWGHKNMSGCRATLNKNDPITIKKMYWWGREADVQTNRLGVQLPILTKKATPVLFSVFLALT